MAVREIQLSGWKAKAFRLFVWFITFGQVCPIAVTLGSWIFYLRPATEPVRRHETVHAEQAAKLGTLNFWFQYVVEHFRHGYMNNKFEIEARQVEISGTLGVLDATAGEHEDPKEEKSP